MSTARKAKATLRTVNDRLEWIRVECHYPNLKAFWRRITDEREFVSYEGLRKYHRDRTPSTEYLSRVAEVCGARLEWLVSGEGAAFKPPMVSDQVRGLSPLVPMNLGRYGDRFTYLTGTAQWLVIDFLNGVFRSTPGYHRDGSPEWKRFLDGVSEFLERPFRSPAIFGRSERLTPHEIDGYARNITAALQCLMPSLRDQYQSTLHRRTNDGKN